MRNARAAPARRPTPLAPRLRASIERCRVVCERTRGHARFAAVLEDADGNARIVARSPAFRATAGKEPRPDGRPLAAYETLMAALAEERWRRTGTMRTIHEGAGPGARHAGVVRGAARAHRRGPRADAGAQRGRRP